MINVLNQLTGLSRLTRTKFLSILAVTALLLTTPFSRADSAGNQSDQNGLAGTWLSRLDRLDPGVAPGLVSFMSDGRVILSRPITLGPAPAPAIALIVGTGHGEWIRTGNHEFAYTVFLLVSDLTTDFVNLVKVTSTLKLNHNSDELAENSRVSVLDTKGTLLFSFDIKHVYSRIVAGQ